ncbi:hypothetical protein C8R44DRAFT_741396 [Mycena epipterygia]|nr:hypothetical protein C8R44DRAFT_741396 [Mycena epipterygia]
MTAFTNEGAFGELYYTLMAIKLVTGVTPTCWRVRGEGGGGGGRGRQWGEARDGGEKSGEQRVDVAAPRVWTRAAVRVWTRAAHGCMGVARGWVSAEKSAGCGEVGGRTWALSMRWGRAGLVGAGADASTRWSLRCVGPCRRTWLSTTPGELVAVCAGLSMCVGGAVWGHPAVDIVWVGGCLVEKRAGVDVVRSWRVVPAARYGYQGDNLPWREWSLLLWIQGLSAGGCGRARVVFLLPPFGDVDDRIRYIAQQLGLETVLWQYDSNDWKVGTGNVTTETVQANYDQLVADVGNGVFDGAGAIMLTHELNNYTMQVAMDNYPKLANAFDHIVPIAVAQNKTQPYVETNYTFQSFDSYIANHTAKPPLTSSTGSGSAAGSQSTGSSGSSGALRTFSASLPVLGLALLGAAACIEWTLEDEDEDEDECLCIFVSARLCMPFFSVLFFEVHEELVWRGGDEWFWYIVLD